MYDLAIAIQYPQLVKQVYNFPKIHNAPIKIGGIKDSVNIKAIIEYYIPFANKDGENHMLMIGLTEQLPINTLFGLPSSISILFVLRNFKTGLIIYVV
ncbi:unnamed protein product [Cylindrotheca closterium]|uniref:Uncharacterized protein n=1 Tax=Cylindrotheca closterium TaxID=2856 RepID=A0AAD2CP93_9STRA|nr:unnamed protein product [Cylindrotheca closterium]